MLLTSNKWLLSWKESHTCTRLGLLISNLALVETELDAKGPENLMQFCTAKFSESIVCDISSTLTRACSVPDPNSGNNCENDVYLQSPNQSISEIVRWCYNSIQEELHYYWLPQHLVRFIEKHPIQMRTDVVLMMLRAREVVKNRLACPQLSDSNSYQNVLFY
jgi:hypothetical protein